MRYLIAIIVAGLVIGAGTGFVWQTNRALELRFRQSIKEDQAAGRVPREFDVDRALLNGDMEIMMPAAEQVRLTVAALLTRWRFVLALIVVLVSLGITRLLGR